MASLAVKVAVKVRPLNRRENAQHEKECTMIEPAPGNLKTIKLGPEGKAFTYDYVVDHTERANEFYENSVSYLVDGLFEGFNATVLAYGQTGSGKTYTMGTSGKMSETEEENLGVVPRAARQIFQMIDALIHKYKDKHNKPEISVETKFLELYQDKLVDLYDCKNSTPPRITQDKDNGIQINSTTRKVDNAEMIIDVLQEGAQNRQVGGTNMNAESSRSHAVFIIDITQEIAEFESADEENAERKKLSAKFCLVDLAGSERLGKTGAEGGRKQEGIAINQGLLALGNVISALGNPRKKAHVNYRDTKLTLLLKDSLGGNSKTLMIACISPSAGEINETKNTLEYANRARSIKNTPKKNQDETSLYLASLKERITELEAAIQNCTCGHTTVTTRFKTEPEEEQEEVVENTPENKHVLSQQRQISTNSLLNFSRQGLSSLDDEAMKISQPICPSALFTDEQSLMVHQKNEDLEARVNSVQIVNTRISHELAELKTRMALLKISYKATNDKEMDAMMIQQLRDYKLKNEELELEMCCRKKYYSLLDEYRRVRETCIQSVTNQNNERMAQDILALAEDDVIRRAEFYDSLPGTILKPRKRKRRRRAKYRLLPKQLSSCLFDLADYEDASEEVLNTVLKAEAIYSSYRDADYYECREKIIYENELQIILKEREKNNQRLEQLSLGFKEKSKLEEKITMGQTELMEEFRKESESNASVEQVEPSLYSADDYADASGEVLAMMRRSETAFARENVRQKLKEQKESRKESEPNACVEQEEPSLYSAEDYADASGEVLAMMRRSETAFARENSRQKLKEQKESKKESESIASVEQEDPSLYSAEDYADASGEVLAMMRRSETTFARENSRQKLKEQKESKKESESIASVEREEPSLYSAEDYADASGEVLAMMRRSETAFARDNARQKLKEQKESKKESESIASVEQVEPSLYSADDYADASGEVLAMMRRSETAFARENARQKLKEQKESKKESESIASVEQEEPTLYSADDYADASGEVLAMMRRSETAFARENARQKLKEQKESKKESESIASVEREEPSLYSAEDYADASGEVLAMMRRSETTFARENDRQKLKEQKESKKESEPNAMVEQEEKLVYDLNNTFADTPDEIPRATGVPMTRSKGRVSLRDLKLPCNSSDPLHSGVIQESSIESYNEPNREVVPMISFPGGERDTEGISQQDNCFPGQVEVLNNTLREQPISLSDRTAVTINSSLFPTAEQHYNAGDLISSLPEEDQAIQVAIQMENIDNVTVPSPVPPIEFINSETSNPYYLKYLDFSTDTNSEIDFDENELLHEADEFNPNDNILNPDVRILLEDINLRKNLNRQLKQEKVRNSSMSNQSRDRIRELEVKINRLEELRDKLTKELKESKNSAKVAKNPKKNSDEKKVSNLSKELTEEKKKVTSLNKELNEEKKKSKQLEKELTQAQGIENWKIAFEISEKKRKELEANIKFSKKKVDIMVKDQANKIKDFEKKAEIQMNNDKSKTKEVSKCNAENNKLNKEYTESKKKIVNLGEKNSRLQSLLTETMAKLTKNKSAPPTSTAKKNAAITMNSSKLGDRINAPCRTPSMRESKEQEAKDTAKSLESIEKLINSNLNKPGVMQQIKVLVEKRVNSQIDRNRKSVVRKIAAIEMNKKEGSFDKSIQKDDKSIELRGLKFDAKKVAGDLPEDITSFVSGLNEKRCKRTLEAIFLHSLYEGIRKKVKILEEERINSAINEFTEKISKIEKFRIFIKDELMIVDTRAKKTRNPSLNHSYSTSDLSHVKLNSLPSQSEQISIRVPSSENIRSASPILSSTSRHNTSKSNLSARAGYHGGLSSNSNSNSTSNLRSSSPAKSISSLQNKSAATSSTGSLCPNKQAPPNKSPTKHPTLARTKTQYPLPHPRDPVKKAVSVSTPLSPQARNFPLCQSADDTLLTPTTKPPFLAFPPRSNSNKKPSPSNSQPVCTSKRVNTIPIRHANSPVVLHPTTKFISVVSPTPNSNPSTPLSSLITKPNSTQTKPKQLQTEPILSTKHSPAKAITHSQESQNSAHQKYKQPIKAARKLDILKPCPTYCEENMKSILTLQLGEDALITASSNCTIRCLDLETLKEKYAQGPMHITDIVRKLEYRMCDKLLYVSSGKKIKIFDLRTQEPVFEIRGFCGDKSTISDMVTTMDPNFIYLACGPDVLVWELTSNKLYGKLIGNSSTITTMCYGVRDSKQPFLAICCKDQSVKIYDYPEAHWCKLTDCSIDSASSSSLNQIHSPKPAKLSIKSFSFPENVYTPLFQGFMSKPPFVASKMAYLNNSSIVHYEDVLLLSNNVDIFQYNLYENKLQNQINTVQSAKNNSKNISDLTNMVIFPNQPLLVTTCRKGSINFWDPTTLKQFGKQNCFANTQFLYDNQHVMILSCNSRMIATTNNKKSLSSDEKEPPRSDSLPAVDLSPARQYHLKQIASSLEEDDPLAAYERYICWYRDVTPNLGIEYYRILEDCLTFCKEHNLMRRYDQDIRFVRIWMSYAEHHQESQRIYEYIRGHGIGAGLAYYYEHRSRSLEASGDPSGAELVLSEGIAALAQPVGRLQRLLRELRERAAISCSAASPESAEAERNALGQLESLRPDTQQQQQLQQQHEHRGARKADFSVYVDTNVSQSAVPLAYPNTSVPTCEKSTQENTQAPRKWIHSTIASAVRPAAEEFSVYPDPVPCNVLRQRSGEEEPNPLEVLEQRPSRKIRLFGCTIQEVTKECPTKDGVPFIVCRIAEYLSEYGLNKEGLFRKNGNIKVMDRLRCKFEDEGNADLVTANDVYAAASLMMLFFRSLKEPLISDQLIYQITRAKQEFELDSSGFLQQLRLLLDQLQPVNYTVLKYVVKFLLKVAGYEKGKKFTVIFLARRIAPSLIRFVPGMEKREQRMTYILIKCIQHLGTLFN